MIRQACVICCTLACLLSGPTRPSAAQSLPAGPERPGSLPANPEFRLYGDDTTLILLEYSNPPSEAFTLRRCLRDGGGGGGAGGLDPFTEPVSDEGRVVLGAMSGGALHLFFESGTQVRWSGAGRSIQAAFGTGHGSAPLAVSDAPAPATLYAIGPVAWAVTLPVASAPATSAPAEEEDANLGLWALVGSRWLALGGLPALERPSGLHLVCGAKYLYLLARTPDGWRIWRSGRATTVEAPGGEKGLAKISRSPWEPCAVPAGLNMAVTPEQLNPLMVQNRLVLVIERPIGGQAGRMQLEFIRQDGTRWMDSETRLAREAGGKPAEFPTGTTAVASAMGKVAVVWAAPAPATRRVEETEPAGLAYQLFMPDGHAVGAPIHLLDTSASSPGQTTREDVIYLFTSMVLTIVLLGIYTWRRDEMMVPVIVPSGFVLASRGRRLAGMLIDLAPAFVLALLLVSAGTARLVVQIILSDPLFFMAGPGTLSQAQKGTLFQFGWTLCLTYSTLCLLAEIGFGLTLGKWLLGMRVCAVNLTAPSRRQILLRNVLRYLEVNPLTFYLLLVMVLLTRNRQRVGDLVARTLVLQVLDPTAKLPEPGTATPPPLTRKIDSSKPHGPKDED